MTRIIVFGHSITYGFWDTEGGWTQRLRKYLDERALEKQEEELIFGVYNQGVPGDTTRELLERFESEIEARNNEEDIVLVFQIGANDIQYLREQERIRVGRDEFRKNMVELVGKATNYTENILFVGEAYTTINGPMPYAPSKEMNDQRLENYVQIQREVCQEKDVDFLDLRSVLSKEEWSELLEDGAHPNNEGHQLIFEEVREKLEEMNLL